MASRLVSVATSRATPASASHSTPVTAHRVLSFFSAANAVRLMSVRSTPAVISWYRPPASNVGMSGNSWGSPPGNSNRPVLSRIFVASASASRVMSRSPVSRSACERR